MNNLNNSLAPGKQQFADSLIEIKTQQDALKIAMPEEDWPTPMQIKTELQPVMKFSPSLLPSHFRDFVVDVSHRMQCPPDFVAVALVIVAGTVIGSGCEIRPKKEDDWRVVPNLWGGVIGKPGVMKSNAIEEALKFLTELERKEKKDFDAQLQEYELDSEVYDAKRGALKDRLKTAAKSSEDADVEAAKIELSKLASPSKPICKRLKTNDATIEKLGEMLGSNPRGILLARDELMGLFTSWDREDRAQDRAFFLEAWNGFGSFTTDRIGRGTVEISNMCMSLLGGTQPSKILPYLAYAQKGSNNDGLVQRLQLFVYPDDVESWQLVDQAPNREARQKVADTLGFLATCDFKSFGATADAEGEKPYLRFAEDAQIAFYEWLKELEKQKIRGANAEDEPLLVEHLSKYRSLLPSLALILHLVEECSTTKQTGAVSKIATERAIAWCEYLESHARRIYGMVANLHQKAASKLATMIMQGKLSDGFTARDLYKREWQYLTKETTPDAIEELVDAGWLREYSTQDGNNRPTRRYLINPKILSRKK